MADISEFVDPNADFDENNPLRSDAVHVQGNTKRGKLCELINNTGEQLPQDELQDILNALVENDAFGFTTLSANGGDTINLERKESSHIQIGENLYRLIVYRYTARIEKF